MYNVAKMTCLQHYWHVLNVIKTVIMILHPISSSETLKIEGWYSVSFFTKVRSKISQGKPGNQSNKQPELITAT